MTIYFEQHSNRKAEKMFFMFLRDRLGDISHINSNYQLPADYIHRLIAPPRVLSSITNCKFISDKKKKLAYEYLSKLPNKVKVARDISDLSVDFVIEDEGHLIFLEFHEKQHYRLSDYRLKPVFSPNNDRFEIPRFLQRLMKDIWRWENLDNFKIIWHNWFEKNTNIMLKFNDGENEEFVLPDKFSISAL